MNLVQIEYFLLVAETGSFRKTAELMYVSQPAVSKQISLLEKEWNVILFDRSYRMATLTESGKLMYKKLSAFRDEFRAALKDARLIDKCATTELRVGILERLNMGNLLDIFSDFQARHQDILLTVEQVALNKLTIDSLNAYYDMILNFDTVLAKAKALEIHKLVRSRNLIILSRDNPILKKPDLSIQDLNHQRFYIPGTDTDTETISLDIVIRIISSHGLRGIDYVMVPNLASVIVAVEMNFGIGIVDETVLLPNDGSIVSIPVGNPFYVELAWHKENTNPGIRLLADEIMQKLEYENRISEE